MAIRDTLNFRVLYNQFWFFYTLNIVPYIFHICTLIMVFGYQVLSYTHLQI